LNSEEMRILEGKFRDRPLRVTEAEGLRPTARRTREVVFEFAGSRVPGARFLDLCAGSGAVGCEALSRGAAQVTFVDSSPEACAVVAANVEACGESARRQSEVELVDAEQFLRAAAGDEEQSWDVAFFDPPYAMDYSAVLELFAQGRVFKRRGGVLIVEHHSGRKLPETLGVLRRWRSVRLGDSCVSFYEQKYSRPQN
jgi:16S rRNA (guanine966-N2)-methyltransferase